MCAYLAAVYLVWDARRLADDDMVEYFRQRAVGSAIVAGVVVTAGVWVLHDDATYVFHGLLSRALPLLIPSAAMHRNWKKQSCRKRTMCWRR